MRVVGDSTHTWTFSCCESSPEVVTAFLRVLARSIHEPDKHEVATSWGCWCQWWWLQTWYFTQPCAHLVQGKYTPDCHRYFQHLVLASWYPALRPRIWKQHQTATSSDSKDNSTRRLSVGTDCWKHKKSLSFLPCLTRIVPFEPDSGISLFFNFWV